MPRSGLGFIQRFWNVLPSPKIQFCQNYLDKAEKYACRAIPTTNQSKDKNSAFLLLPQPINPMAAKLNYSH